MFLGLRTIPSRGLEKMKLCCGMALCMMPAMGLGRIRAKEPKRIQSLVAKPPIEERAGEEGLLDVPLRSLPGHRALVAGPESIEHVPIVLCAAIPVTFCSGSGHNGKSLC